MRCIQRPNMGEILKKMLDKVLDEPEANTKENLLEYLKTMDDFSL